MVGVHKLLLKPHPLQLVGAQDLFPRLQLLLLQLLRLPLDGVMLLYRLRHLLHLHLLLVDGTLLLLRKTGTVLVDGKSDASFLLILASYTSGRHGYVPNDWPC